MNIDAQTLRSILVDGSYVSEADMAKAEDFAKKHHSSATEYLLIQGLITKDLLGQAIAEWAGIRYADLNSYVPTKEQILRIPESLARKFRVVIFKDTKEEFVVTTDEPKQPGVMEALFELFGRSDVVLAFSLTEDINSVFNVYRKPLETRFARIVEGQRKVAPEILEEIFNDALVFRASDIHLEPQEEEIVVRFRVDGVLQEAGHLSREYYENILNRIKVQAHLRIDEHLAPQDGAIRHVSEECGITDMRISVAPTVYGEKVVIRILSEYVRGFTLSDLGLPLEGQRLVLEIAKKPFGMILVTGPTGSGKTTTLYALVKVLNEPDVNITTIEDPVEYKLLGVNQMQVNPHVGLTFAKGLRSIVRQDPDIILVGEVRDRDTAEISVNAALTGHLLLTTLHANDAATGIPRLLDMGVEPFLLSSVLELICAQRLVRKVCLDCRYSKVVSSAYIKKISPDAVRFFPLASITLYKGKGCAMCGFTGYRGRTAIFEFIRVTPEIQNLILRHPSMQEVREIAARQGTRFIFEDGIEKVRAGITTLEEIIRVAAPPVLSESHYNQEASVFGSKRKVLKKPSENPDL